MDTFTSGVLSAVLIAAGFYILFCVIRAAVESALRRDRELRREEELAERVAAEERSGPTTSL